MTGQGSGHEGASARQARAADPVHSTWLSANAGSGKTRVLTDRVARLLLDGVNPQHILCLTYTKAAATEMQNRLFRRLGEWSMRPDDELTAELAALGATGPFPVRKLRDARRLFAQALETPGGLRIQTIHAFCAGLLRRFPLEAGVKPRFVELDDRSASLLRTEVADALAGGPQSGRVDMLARQFTGSDFDKLLLAITEQADGLRALPDDAALARLFDLPPKLTGDSLATEVLGSQGDLLEQLAFHCAAGGATDRKAAEKLARVRTLRPGLGDLALLESIVLFGEGAKSPFGAKVGAFPTKETRARLADAVPDLEALMLSVQAARPARLALQAVDRTATLRDFAAVFLPSYDTAKQARGALDFDDLIRRAQQLLTDPTVADWVRFRLDSGMDHVLVDEAQDTSPRQWDVINLLTQDLGAGDGGRLRTRRSLFVVGDKKQSIYSFQGADPARFDTMQAHFRTRLAQTAAPLLSLTLDHSFRSSQAILRAVDATFRGPMRQGLGAEDPLHIAFKSDLPGRVDLWPPILPEDAPENDRHWTDPVDQQGPEDPVQRLAHAVAQAARHMVDNETIPVADRTGLLRRPVTEGDILILVQRRAPIFGAIIRELKAAELNVAGADRLKLGGELAVKDIAAVLRFLALPEDDLALAEALKSPLFGWSEAALYALAQPRPKHGYLWSALRDGAPTPALAILNDLRDRVDFLRPYDLIQHLLVRHNGRHRLLERLGPEAEDGIDALLAQAQTYEQAEVPSLTGFVEWMMTDDVDVKRAADTAGRQIRVMTVHGAKGLEAPIVILPDSAIRKPSAPDPLIAGGSLTFWAGPKGEAPPILRDLETARQLREAEERRRLLYVAMTRAECWLIVCAAKETGDVGDSWHAMVQAGMDHAGAVSLPMPWGVGLRLTHGDWTAAPLTALAEPDLPPALIPDLPPPGAALPVAGAVLSPSNLGGAKTLPGDPALIEGEAALAQGRLMHLLLEHLPAHPPGKRAAVARALAESLGEADLTGPSEPLINDALRLLEDPALAGAFGADDLTEAPIGGVLPLLAGQRIMGFVDRLQIGPDRVRIIDYKTNRLVPTRPEDVPEGLLRQMGAYLALLDAIWPDKQAEVAILWTAGGGVMSLPRALCMAALQRAVLP